MKGKLMNRVLVGLVLLGALAMANGCNTVHGAGQDIKNGGQDVQNAADNNK